MCVSHGAVTRKSSTVPEMTIRAGWDIFKIDAWVGFAWHIGMLTKMGVKSLYVDVTGIIGVIEVQK